MWTVSRSSFRDWRRPTVGRRQVGSGTGESMAERWSRPWRLWGVADQGSRDVLGTPRHPTPAAETGPVSSSNRKWERPAAFSPVIPKPGVWYMRCSSVSWVFLKSPEHLLFKRFQTSWESIDREDFGTGIMWRKGDCSRGRPKDEGLRWTPSSPSRA
ncbi:hypothetical protein GWK47_050328 [Chionoecetes opilio]|uniref:Uncharacterized protein n=1 Tax=Chionoecetes opilio TaxID=41210 RepID=A0A8J4YAX8_CHIOP|nr:hypothetical protein GWK47_050328 [Chionoecetes opilio]